MLAHEQPTDSSGHAEPRGVMEEQRYLLLLRRTVWVGCFLGFVATIYFLLGLSGYVGNSFLNLGVAAVLVFSAGYFLVHFFAIPLRTTRLGRVVWSAILVFFLAELALCLLPPISRDELTHHLAIPKLYANAGRIIEVPMAPYAYYPMLLDMLYTPWVYWGYDFVPKLIHGLYGYLTGLLLFAYLSRRMSSVYGLVGFFLFVSTPAIARLSHWGYIDLGIAFYTTAALLALLCWREERNNFAWLSLAGLSLGFALATKPNGLVVAFLMGFLFLFVVVAPPRKSWAGIGREIFLLVALTSLPFLPWLIKNWVQTGNPVFPLLASFFTSAPAHGSRGGGGGLSLFAKRELLYGESIWQIIGLPARVFFSGQDDNPQFFDGVLTPVLVILLPWIFKGKWLEEKRLLLSFAALFLFYAVFLVEMRIRYILPIVAPLVILAVYGIFNIYLRIRRPALLFAGLVLFAAWHGAYLVIYFRDASPLAYLSGAETQAAYLARKLAEYPALQYINRDTESSAKIYLLFAGRRAYYCEREYFHDGGELPEFLVAAIRSAKSPADIAETLRRKQITHLMAREDLLARYLFQTLSPAEVAVWNQFVQSALQAKFRDGGYAVYLLDD